MVLKIVAGILAVALLGAFLAPVILKLKELSLSAVLIIGFVMMLVDLWQSFKAKDD